MPGTPPLRWIGYLLVILLPALLFFTSLSWLSEHMQKELEQSEARLDGLQKVRSLYEVLMSLQRLRGLDNYTQQSGAIVSLTERREQELQQLQAYLTLMVADQQLQHLGLHSKMKRLSEQTTEIIEAEWGEPKQRFIAYTELIWMLQDLISITGDLSQVSRDDNHQRHFYTESYIRLLPWLAESIGRLRGQTSLLLEDRLSQDQRFELRYLVEQLQDQIEQYDVSYRLSSQQQSPDPRYAQITSQLIEGSLRYTTQILSLLDGQQQGEQDLSLFDQGSELIELVNQLHRQAYSYLAVLFEGYHAELRDEWDLLLLLNILELLAIYLGLIFAYRTISGAFRRLKASEYFLQRVLNTIPARVFWKDRNLNYLGCNSLFAKDAGLDRPQQVTGRDDFSMCWQDNAQQYRDDDQAVIDSGQAKLHYEEPQLRSDGSQMWLESSKVPLENERGEIIGVLGVYEDVSERKQAELALTQSELRLRSVLDTMADALVTIDPQGIVQGFNRSAEQIFGYLADEVIGQNVSLLMPEPYRSEHDGYMASYLGSGKARIIGTRREIVARRSNGEIFPIELAVAEVHEGGLRLFSGVIRDITEQKRNERLKSEFISTVSHELRTPLTAIRGSLGLLNSGALGSFDDKVKQMFDIASNNTERLLMLINDILDIQKIEADQINLELTVVDIGEVISKSLEEGRLFAEQYTIRFEVLGEPSLMAIADKGWLLKVMGNLLSNAAKFSPQGEVVTIRLSQLSKKTVRISIADRGVGIPLAFQDKVYEKFTQGDSSDTREKGGTGLGMSIVKALTEKMGGAISFETSEGHGTTFHVDLRAS